MASEGWQGFTIPDLQGTPEDLNNSRSEADGPLRRLCLFLALRYVTNPSLPWSRCRVFRVGPVLPVEELARNALDTEESFQPPRLECCPRSEGPKLATSIEESHVLLQSLETIMRRIGLSCAQFAYIRGSCFCPSRQKEEPGSHRNDTVTHYHSFSSKNPNQPNQPFSLFLQSP